jgi:hypothetical protein
VGGVAVLDLFLYICGGIWGAKLLTAKRPLNVAVCQSPPLHCKKKTMHLYNRNDELIKIDENFINGFLTPIAILRDYTTREVGFNYYFKRMKDNKLIIDSISEELRLSFNTFTNREGERYKCEEQVEVLINKGIFLEEIEKWEVNLATEIDFWTGSTLTNTIKDENKMSAWQDKPNLLSIELIELLKVFFYPNEIKAFKYEGAISNHLFYHWGGLKWLDIVFSNQEENYLLHFDLSD